MKSFITSGPDFIQRYMFYDTVKITKHKNLEFVTLLGETRSVSKPCSLYQLKCQIKLLIYSIERLF